MAAVKIKSPRECPPEARKHLRKRVDERTFLATMAKQLDAWLKTGPHAPDLAEAPQGWFKRFGSFLILGEAECIKTLFTIYAPGNPRPIPWILTNGKSVGEKG
jgi:hypothetical protein